MSFLEPTGGIWPRFFGRKNRLPDVTCWTGPPPRPRMEFASSPLSPPGFLKDIFRFGNPESQPKSFICQWHPGWEVVTSWVRGRCQDIIISVRRKPPSCNQVPRNWNPCCCDWAFMDFISNDFFLIWRAHWKKRPSCVGYMGGFYYHEKTTRIQWKVRVFFCCVAHVTIEKTKPPNESYFFDVFFTIW